MSVLLSVLIPTITERKKQFEKLYDRINKLAKSYPIEILHLCDNKEMSIGEKKNRLINMASGEYVLIIDDDDDIRDDYFDIILPILQKDKPDCIGYLVRCTGVAVGETSIISIKYPEWANNIDGYSMVRYTHEKVPIKRIHAIDAGFSFMRYYDDYCFSMNLKRSGRLKTEVFVNQYMYIYQHQQTSDPDEKYGFKKQYENKN